MQSFSPPVAPDLSDVLRSFRSRPAETLLRRWNWKSAVTSSLARAILFFSVNIAAGSSAAWAAFWTEFLFRATTAGFYGAITQGLSTVRPAWKGTLAALVVLPFFNHSLELLVHWLSGTEVLAGSIVASVCFTAVSSAFHCFAMRQGLMIVGDGSQGLLSDLVQMPRAIFLFATAPFVTMWRLAAAPADSE
jgi:hypothetical protein